MDEFGLPESMDQDEKLATVKEELPFRNPPLPLPSAAPFAQYAPTSVKVHVKQATDAQQPKPRPVEEDDKGAGCCKCVIM